MTARTTRRRIPWVVFLAVVLATPLVTPGNGAGAATVPSPPTNLAVVAGPTTDVMTVTWSRAGVDRGLGDHGVPHRDRRRRRTLRRADQHRQDQAQVRRHLPRARRPARSA